MINKTEATKLIKAINIYALEEYVAQALNPQVEIAEQLEEGGSGRTVERALLGVKTAADHLHDAVANLRKAQETALAELK